MEKKYAIASVRMHFIIVQSIHRKTVFIFKLPYNLMLSSPHFFSPKHISCGGRRFSRFLLSLILGGANEIVGGLDGSEDDASCDWENLFDYYCCDVLLCY